MRGFAVRGFAVRGFAVRGCVRFAVRGVGRVLLFMVFTSWN